MNKPTWKIIVMLIAILVLVAGGYWYFFARTTKTSTEPVTNEPTNGFEPLNRPATGGNLPTNTGTNNNGNNISTTTSVATKIPILRLLSNTPVGGYGASTTVIITPVVATSSTGTTTKKLTKPQTTSRDVAVVRWVDRGRGNIYEARDDSLAITTLSNTVLPKIYDSVWNKNLTIFVGSMLDDDSSWATTLYAELKTQTASNTKVATSTYNATSTTVSNNSKLPLTPFTLKGNNLSDRVISYATSPKKDKVLMVVNESGVGVGYTATFDGKSITKIFDTPMTQINVDWPEDNTIAIITKGSASQSGFLYLINMKTGTWKKVAGPMLGLSAKVSHDAKFAIVSSVNSDKKLQTNIYSIADATITDAVVRTLADKCAWGNFYKEIVYCATPSQLTNATYPDDWAMGKVSFADKIWQINVLTGEIHLISSILDESDRVIDAFNLGLDPKTIICTS
jgi:hypothetical protein